VLSAALLAAGCGGQSNIHVQGSGVPAVTTVPAGAAVSGGSLGANIQGVSTLGALFAIGILSGAYASDGALSASQRVPELDPFRRVAERDCTQPIEDWSANLKCR
jgi:hypothetical protein